MHWVGWGKITKPKKEGGLGLHSTKGRHLALLANLNWRFHNEKDALWRKVLEKKYLIPHRLASKAKDKMQCSRNWLAMRKGRDIFKAGSRWVLGRESNLNFGRIIGFPLVLSVVLCKVLSLYKKLTSK